MAKPKGAPVLIWRAVKDLIDSGEIATVQIGRAPIWVVTKRCRRLSIPKWSIIVPNVSRDIAMLLSDISKLVKQQEHILDDGYAEKEIPELKEVIKTLIGLSQTYGTQAKLNGKNRDRFIFEFRSMLTRIEVSPVIRKATRKAINSALTGFVSDLEDGKLEGTIASAIGIIFNRLNDLGTIMPAIDLRRQTALEAICQLERDAWLVAFKVKALKRSLKPKSNVEIGLLTCIREIKLPPFQPYRPNIRNCQRLLCLAIGQARHERWESAEKLINRAILRLGYSPIDLLPAKSA